MKIGLLTIHNALNYGAIFQAYATQELLSRYGNVEIINYKNEHIERLYSPLNIRLGNNILKNLIREAFLLRSKVVRQKKFNKFFKCHFNLSKVDGFDTEFEKEYDLYVCGSDQIWNPKITNGVDVLNEDYFLGSLPKDVKKISYASSLGSYRYNAIQEKRIKELLNDFSFLSVREKDGAEYLEKVIDRKVNQVLDPTLLLSKDEWIKKLGLTKNRSSEEYILVYTVPRSDILKDAIKYYAKKGIKIISVDPSIRKAGKVDKQIRDAGPEEFLNLFLNAKMILTDSFHGVCFSINFKKNFVALSSGVASNRMKNILKITAMDSRFVENINDLEKIQPVKEEECIKAHSLLNEYKKNSISYLDEAFKV